MKKLAILFVTLLSGVSLSFAQVQVAVPTLYGDVDPEAENQCLSLSNNLRLYARDATTNGEVSMLQDFLNTQGYLTSLPTGYFGQATFAAAKKFQAANGLLNSGFVGALTRGKIKDISCSGGASVPASPTNPTTGGTSLPAGCTASTLFSPMTGEKCVAVSSTVPVPIVGGGSLRIERSAHNPLAVKAYFYLGSSCSNYTLSWGDGTNSNFKLPDGMYCTQVVPTEPFVKEHVYTKAGTYKIAFQTGANPQRTSVVTVGDNNTCPDGMPPTGDGCIIKCPNGTTVVGNQPCPVTPTCPTPGTVPVCPGTSIQVPYNNQTCSWNWGVCSTVPTLSSPQVRFIENPTLKLETIDGREAVLLGRTVVEVTAGGKDVFIPRQSSALTFMNQNGDSIYVNSYSGWAEIVSGDASNVPGEGSIKIPTGKSAKIAFYAKVQSGVLFAGGYLVSLKPILYSTGIYEGPGINLIDVPYNKSNLVPVIGEVSPYIKEITADATPQINVTIHGVRFHPTSNLVSIGGIERTLPSIANGLYINTTLSAFGLTAGKDYIVQVIHPQNGASNLRVLTTGDTTTGSASASIVGTPTLKLVYAMPKPGFVDPTGGEASLEASFTVDVKAGSEKIVIGKNSIPNDPKGMMFSISLNSPNSVQIPAYTSENVMVNIPDMGATVQIGDTYIIQPGQTVRFVASRTWNPKTMFAGSYNSSIRLSGYSGELLPSNQTQQTNAVTVVGEVSPYISMVTVDADGTVRVTGERFDLQDNKVVVDGVTLISAVKGDSRLMTFDPAMYNLAPGGHTIYIKNSVKGDSNSYYFVVNGNQGTSVYAASAEIVGSQSTYTPGQVIKFSVSGTDSTGAVASPLKGLHVQAYMRDSINDDPTTFQTTMVNGQYQSVNAEYNYATKMWVVTMTAPSDNLRSRKIFATLYCSDSSLGCKMSPITTENPLGQITKSFAFTIATPVVQPTVSATANQVTTLRSGQRYQLFSIKVDNLTRSNPITAFVLTLDAPGSGVFKQIEILDANTGAQVGMKSGLAGYLKFETAGEYAGTKEFSVVATTEPTFASYYTTMQVQAVFDGVIVGGQTIAPTGGRVFGPKMKVTNEPIMISDPMICQDGRAPVNGTCPPLIPTYSPTSLNTPQFQVLASSIRSLEQNYASAVGGTIALSAPTTLTAVNEEIINFTGLKRGANEVRVSSLKKILNTISPSVSIGCANLSTTNTLYGPTTEECVRVFQNLNELEPTGTVNEATNKALNRVLVR